MNALTRIARLVGHKSLGRVLLPLLWVSLIAKWTHVPYADTANSIIVGAFLLQLAAECVMDWRDVRTLAERMPSEFIARWPMAVKNIQHTTNAYCRAQALFACLAFTSIAVIVFSFSKEALAFIETHKAFAILLLVLVTLFLAHRWGYRYRREIEKSDLPSRFNREVSSADQQELESVLSRHGFSLDTYAKAGAVLDIRRRNSGIVEA